MFTLIYARMSVLSILFILLGAPHLWAQAAPNGVHYQGQILSTASSTPLEAASVTFTFQIVSPGAEGCVLYEETQILNMTGSNGVFDLIVGQGTPTSGGASNNPSPTLTLAQVFNNTGTLTGLHCASGTTYTPLTGQGRKLTVKFNDGSVTSTLSSAINLHSVPFAFYADSVQGKTPADLVQVNNSTAAVTQANVEAIFASSSAVTALLALINGTSTQYITSSTTGGAALPSFSAGGGTPASPSEGDIWYNSTTHSLQYKSNSGVETVSASGTVAVANGGTGTTTGSITGTGALTFAAGGANQNVTLTPSGTGYTVLNGSVGIGSASPRAKLDVQGAVISKAAVVNPTSTIDFSTGNLQYTNGNCGSFTLYNLKDGGTYSFAVKGATAATCSFTAYSDSGSSSLTVHLPPDHGPTIVSTHTMYAFMVIGTDVYVSWIAGY